MKETDNKKGLWEIESIIAEFRITIGKLEDSEESTAKGWKEYMSKKKKGTLVINSHLNNGNTRKSENRIVGSRKLTKKL